MARLRSPNYPGMGLPTAIERARTVHDREQHLAAPTEVIARHLGYTGLNGTSLKALSALLKYGLLEKTKDDKRKITNLAVQILHPRTLAERAEGIREAAFRPVLFNEIAKEWPNGTPSDENLRAYLLRRNFATDAISDVIAFYRETMELVTRESGGYTPQSADGRESSMANHLSPKSVNTGAPVLGSPRLGTTSVKIEDDRIEVSAVLLFQENIEALITKLQAIKGLRPRAADEIKKDDGAAT